VVPGTSYNFVRHSRALSNGLIMDDFLTLPDPAQIGRIAIRLVSSAALGALLGAERQAGGKPAGLRTHMLVCLGATLFVVAPAEAGLSPGDVGRAIQGVAAGIGFLGAGSIIKVAEREHVTGLTTAASIWLTAAIGIAVAVGRIWVAVLGALCAWLILFGVRSLEQNVDAGANDHQVR
jgi:putative Mg2+ transporter-C (MgtC) family protein